MVINMLRTFVFAGVLMMLGASVSDAQYRDSYPREEQYVEYDDTYEDPYPGYDRELLGDPDYYDDDYGYSEPDTDVGMFASLGYDGRWHLTAGFGWVWRPYVSVGWRPYTHGQWVWTSHGWTWVSYEPFGWATYHYGYWHSDPVFGWVWIPGYEWSATRVRFAYYDNYIAWTPMPYPGYHCPSPWSTAGVNVWITIGADRFCDPYPYRHYVTPRYKSVYRETVAYKAPARHHVERYVGSPVRTSKVEFKATKYTKTAPVFSDRGVSSRGAKFDRSPQRVKSTTSRELRTQTRTYEAPKSVTRSEPRVTTKGKSRQEITRQPVTRKSQPQFSRELQPQRDVREQRMTRTERPSATKQQVTKAKRSGEPRVIQRAERTERQRPQVQRAERVERSRPQFQASRSSGAERKSASIEKRSPQNRVEKRDVAKVKGLTLRERTRQQGPVSILQEVTNQRPAVRTRERPVVVFL
jgi:hypothetical protein